MSTVALDFDLEEDLEVAKNTHFYLCVQQKRPESPLDTTNPFLEDEQGQDVGTEKDEDLAKVS